MLWATSEGFGPLGASWNYRPASNHLGWQPILLNPLPDPLSADVEFSRGLGHADVLVSHANIIRQQVAAVK